MEKKSYNTGFILVDKPTGPTSHDVVDELRKATGIKKIGHAGTLDPFASGLLVIAIGRESTRKISRFVKMDKEYVATLFLGATSDTYDRTGVIIRNADADKGKTDKVAIAAALKKFIGKQKQIPPMHSAKKVGGKKLYELARKGIEIERQPSDIEVYSIDLLEYGWPLLKIRIRCSTGTYIRSLADDFGRLISAGAYLTELERTAIGNFRLSDAIPLREISENNWQERLSADSWEPES
jgi:tRNA pseudouridine55 synthase